MDTRQATGEIKGKNIIDIGDRIKVNYLDDSDEPKEIIGILISMGSDFIEINGTTPKENISIDRINTITKSNN